MFHNHNSIHAKPDKKMSRNRDEVGHSKRIIKKAANADRRRRDRVTTQESD